MDNPEEVKQEEKVSYKEILIIPKIILALIVVVFGMAGPAFLEPVLAIYLAKVLHLGSTAIGFIFALPTLGYTIAMKLLSKIPKEVDRKHVLFVGLFIEGASFVFVGPWSVISEPNLVTASIGLLLLGFGSAWAYIPSLPYLTDIATEKWPRSNKEHLGNTLSTIMGTTHYFGETVGPIFGGLSCYSFGTADGFAFFGGLILAYFLIYGLANGQFSAFAKKDFYSKQEDSSSIGKEEHYDKVELGKI
jgi:hypothetical protein